MNVIKIKNKIENFESSGKSMKSLILIWILFTSTSPFQFYAMVPHHPYKLLTFFVVVSMLTLMIRDRRGLFSNNSNNIIYYIILIQSVYSFLAIFIHSFSLDIFLIENGLVYLNLFIQLIVVLFSFAFICSYGLIHKLAVSMIPVMVIMAGFSAVIFFLGLIINLQPFSFTALSDHRDINNYILGFSSSVSEYSFGSVIRSSGYFDEPGTLAFYIVIAMLLNKMYGYSKIAEYFLIAFGLCTVSLAFYISLILYYFIFGIIERRLRVVLWLVVIVLTLSLTIFEFSNKSELGRVVYELTVHRIMPPDESENKLFKGDNRSENFEYAKQAFFQSPFFGQGMLAHSSEKNEFFGKLCCNPLHPFASDGFVGTLVFFLIYIYWGFYILNKRPFDYISAGSWFIIFVNMLQRPGATGGTFGYFVFIFLLEASRWRKSQQRLSSSQVVLGPVSPKKPTSSLSQ